MSAHLFVALGVVLLVFLLLRYDRLVLFCFVLFVCLFVCSNCLLICLFFCLLTWYGEAHYDRRSLYGRPHSLEYRCEARIGKRCLWCEARSRDCATWGKEGDSAFGTNSYISDANKIAWVRAFLGWAYKAVDPEVEIPDWRTS